MKNEYRNFATEFFVTFALSVTLAVPSFARPVDNGPPFTRIALFRNESITPIATKIEEIKESFVIGGLDFNGDGTELATNAMIDGLDVHIWNWRGNSHLVRVLHKDAAAGGGNALRYTPDGTLLAVGHEGGGPRGPNNEARIIRIWDTRTGELVNDIRTVKGASGFVEFDFSPDGLTLIRTEESGGLPGNYMVVDSIKMGQQIWGLPTLPFVPTTIAVSADGKFAALGGEALVSRTPVIIHTRIEVVDLTTRQVIRTIDSAFADYDDIQVLAWRPDGEALAAGVVVDPAVGGRFSGPDAVRVFDPSTGKLLVAEAGSQAFVSALGYSRDGRYLIEGYIDGNVRIWDGNHAKLLQKIPVNNHFHTAMALSRDSRHLAIGVGKDISIWELH